MRRSVFRDLLLASTLLLSPLISATHAAAAESRLALVIGQSAYRAVPALPNAENDGKRMAELLANSGFQVTAAPELTPADMRQALSAAAYKIQASGPGSRGGGWRGTGRGPRALTRWRCSRLRRSRMCRSKKPSNASASW